MSTLPPVQYAIVNNEGSVVRYKGKLYRICGVEMRGTTQIEYKLVSVNRMLSGFNEPLFVQPKSVEFLRS